MGGAFAVCTAFVGRKWMSYVGRLADITCFTRLLDGVSEAHHLLGLLHLYGLAAYDALLQFGSRAFSNKRLL
jgi:hypothetical protein